MCSNVIIRFLRAGTCRVLFRHVQYTTNGNAVVRLNTHGFVLGIVAVYGREKSSPAGQGGMEFHSCFRGPIWSGLSDNISRREWSGAHCNTISLS